MSTRLSCDPGLRGCYVYDHTIITSPTDLLPVCLSRVVKAEAQAAAFGAGDSEFRAELVIGQEAAAPPSLPAPRSAATKTAEDVLGVPEQVAEFDADLRRKLDDIVVRCRTKVVDRVDLTAYFLLAKDEPKSKARVDAIKDYLLTAGIEGTQVHVQARQVRKLREHGMGLALRGGVEVSLTHAHCESDRRWDGKAPPFTVRLEDVPLSRKDFPPALVRTLDDLARLIRACELTRVDITSQYLMFEEMGVPRAHEISAYLVGRGVAAEVVKVSERGSLRYRSRSAVMGSGHAVFVDVRRIPDAQSPPLVEPLPARSRSRSNWQAAREKTEPAPVV